MVAGLDPFQLEPASDPEEVGHDHAHLGRARRPGREPHARRGQLADDRVQGGIGPHVDRDVLLVVARELDPPATGIAARPGFELADRDAAIVGDVGRIERRHAPQLAGQVLDGVRPEVLAGGQCVLGEDDGFHGAAG